MVTGPSASAAARSAGSSSSIRSVTAARLVFPRPSTARRCHPAGHARGGGGAQSRHRHQLLPGRVRALAVQPDEEVLAGEWAHAIPGQQLPGAVAAIPLLDRAHRRIQGLDHPQPVAQLADRGHPRVRGQGPIRRADSRLQALPPPAAYPVHQIGDPVRWGRICHFAMVIVRGSEWHLWAFEGRVPGLLAESGLTAPRAQVAWGRPRSAGTPAPVLESAAGLRRGYILPGLAQDRDGRQAQSSQASAIPASTSAIPLWDGW